MRKTEREQRLAKAEAFVKHKLQLILANEAVERLIQAEPDEFTDELREAGYFPENDDEHPPEIFQYWITDADGAHWLTNSGAIVIELAGLYIWCRLCCGQAVWVDHEIQNAAAPICGLPGFE